ncbi:MAG: SDR family NAD(P)-dependent oxidoreductase, partial [Prolixibacteraceae bacterium]|nr:SDR family NAD(P)-dependent oxidoreductase [Prolixibacteraceae bacterium]
MQKKVVVITGASSGIGKALAEKYAQEGWNLVIGARRLERLIALQQRFKDVNILPVKTDVTVEADCEHLISEAVRRFGQIDVLINN